jgi:hypothetical protein
MDFPNLVWALAQFGPRYKFAASIGENESWLSRRLVGRIPFSPSDRERIASALSYPEEWLFAKPAPPRAWESTTEVGS